MYKDLSLLLTVQDIDKALIKKQEKLDELNENLELKACEKHLNEINTNLDKLISKIEDNKNKVKALERNIRHYQNLIKGLDEEIYSGKSNSKELHYLIYEKDKNKETIDDSEIKLMELLENNERDSEFVRRLNMQKKQMIEKYDNIKALIEDKKTELLSDKKKLLNRRKSFEADISDKILNKYEEKKERLNYKFVSRVDESAMCSGCHVKLPSRVIKNLKSNKVEKCDECGRYLIYMTD